MKARRYIAVIAVVGLGLLGALVIVGLQQASVHRRILVTALTYQLDGHAGKIQSLLSTMGTNDTSAIEDAAYKELQAIPSTSPISRADVKVAAVRGGLQCTIDTSRFGVTARVIHQHQEATP